MERKKNEMVYWLAFILTLMVLSISIILYFRLPRSINQNQNVTENVSKETVTVE